MRTRALLAVALAAGSVSVAACGSSATDNAGALQDVVDQIDAGPSWETAEMSNAVGAYLSPSPGSSSGCATRHDATGGYVCYMQYVDANDPQADPQTGVVEVYFDANGDGTHVHPISARAYGQQTS